MKRLGGFFGVLFWLSLVAAPALVAQAHDPLLDPTAGDEDPFPLACADFTGSWKSDNGDRFAIQQRHCSQIKINASYGADGRETLTIVPDNRTRPGPFKGSQVRHRWNSPDNATVLESHRSYVEGGAQITEVVTIERANDHLLLQTTYRTIDYGNGSTPRYEYDQQVFRKQN